MLLILIDKRKILLFLVENGHSMLPTQRNGHPAEPHPCFKAKNFFGGGAADRGRWRGSAFPDALKEALVTVRHLLYKCRVGRYTGVA